MHQPHKATAAFGVTTSPSPPLYPRIQHPVLVFTKEYSNDRKKHYFAGNDSLDRYACRMLISRRLSKDAMKAIGLALTLVAGFTTIPLAIAIMGKKNSSRPEIRSVA